LSLSDNPSSFQVEYNGPAASGSLINRQIKPVHNFNSPEL
jgi:hypothetical protein